MKRRMRAVLCRDLPELNVWRDQFYLKDALLQETGGGEAFVARATQTLYQALLSLRTDTLVESSQLSHLLTQGYTNEQIARAFAKAWLQNNETLYLPRFRWIDAGWMIHGIPVLLSVVTVTLMFFFASHQYPKIVATFVWLTSFLAIPALLLTLVYSWVWRGVLGWFSGAVDTTQEEHRSLDHLIVRLVAQADPNLPQSPPPATAPTLPDIFIASSPPTMLKHRSHPMYQSLEAFNTQRHADLRFSPAGNYAFASTLTSVALGAEELPVAALHYPVVFLLQGPVVPTAVLGLAGHNQFLDNQARWRVQDVPASVRYYPFALANVTDGEPGQMAVALDRAAPHFTSGIGEPLVKSDGTPSDLVLRIQDLLVGHRRHLQATQTVLADLDARGVLLERQLTIQTDSSPWKIDGFRTVDLNRVHAQDDATLARWVRNGTLQVVYLHLASLRNFEKLAELDSAARTA
ncbi:putative SapC family protein [Gammaproteobacteria bacterium]